MFVCSSTPSVLSNLSNSRIQVTITVVPSSTASRNLCRDPGRLLLSISIERAIVVLIILLVAAMFSPLVYMR
ncbi:unnamed protein product [Linum tenue]|uniref:Uncharacterized protein n=1 Tax=Linum tenue TaxID=586396 RepID=A0AAV0QPD2_9ROSI|nr:unnamed protein product [Linum tenue]